MEAEIPVTTIENEVMQPDDLNSEEEESEPLHMNADHRRSTYTYEESRIIKYVRYVRFSSACWLTYLIPATCALIFALFIDSGTSNACDKYLLAWAIVQSVLQICNIFAKISTIIIFSSLPPTPEPEEIEYVQDISQETHKF